MHEMRRARRATRVDSAAFAPEDAPEAPPSPGREKKRAFANETHSWVDEIWGCAAGGLARVASRDDAAREACSRGVLEVSRSGFSGTSSATRLFHEYPLRLMVPRKVGVERPDADCVWCYQVSFGGGLVAGDRAGASVDVADGCACVLATQGTNKVYKHAVSTERKNEDGLSGLSAGEEKTSRETVQALAGRVGAGALLACLPDPTQAFRDARFRQTQRFVLDKTASLVAVDWLVSGRAAFRGGGAGGFVSARGGGVAPGTDARLTEGLERGERWRFASYHTNTEVFVECSSGDETPAKKKRGRGRGRRRDREKSDAFGDENAIGDEKKNERDEDENENASSFVEVCADACRLEGDRSGALARRMGDTHALATVILLGPRCAAAAESARAATRRAAAETVAGGAREVHAVSPKKKGEGDDDVGSTDATKEKKKKDWLLVSVSPVPAPVGCDERAGGIVLRVAGPSTDAVYATLRAALAPLAAELGAPPYAERGLS